MQISFTFDYELCLDDIIGSVENCLIVPTKELQKVFDRYNVHVTYFIDAAYLFMLYKLKDKHKQLQKDFEDVIDNILWLESCGHDIQLHNHPQWYYSKYDEEKGWSLDWKHYRLADLPEEEMFRFFKESKDLLDSFLKKPTCIYRAGGYCLQGIDYVRLFKENGIIADSTVQAGARKKTATHRYDYSNSPEYPYMFSSDVCVENKNGSIYEFPISRYKSLFIMKYKKIKDKWTARPDHRWGDGGGRPKTKISDKLKYYIEVFCFFKIPHACMDWLAYFFLDDCLRYNEKYGSMVIIGHPKNQSRNSVDYVNRFIDRCQARGYHFLSLKERIDVCKL